MTRDRQGSRIRGMSDPATASERKAEVHRRLIAAYADLKANDERREFRKALARAVERTEEGVARWLGDRVEQTGPPSTVLDRIERFLEGRK